MGRERTTEMLEATGHFCYLLAVRDHEVLLVVSHATEEDLLLLVNT